MIEVATRVKSLDPPDWVVFEALAEPDRDPARTWLHLLPGERYPQILESRKPDLVVWSSIWNDRPDARIRFEVDDPRGLRWRLLLDEPAPDEATVRELRRRIDTLIHGNLRGTFGG